jgi:quercetin dioxygenase-like cupin family protein
VAICFVLVGIHLETVMVEVEHWDDVRDGALSEETMRQKLERRGYSVTRYVYAPGTYFPPHSHDVDKIDGVLSGRFRMEMQGQSVTLAAGDCLAVPRTIEHCAQVIGDEPVVSLDAVRTEA